MAREICPSATEPAGLSCPSPVWASRSSVTRWLPFLPHGLSPPFPQADLEELEAEIRPDQVDSAALEILIQRNLKAKLEVIPEAELFEALHAYVEKEEKQALQVTRRWLPTSGCSE